MSVRLSPPRASICDRSPRLREGRSPGSPNHPSSPQKVVPGRHSGSPAAAWPPTSPPLPLSFFSIQERENAHASLAPKACTDPPKMWGPHAHPTAPTRTHACAPHSPWARLTDCKPLPPAMLQPPSLPSELAEGGGPPSPSLPRGVDQHSPSECFLALRGPPRSPGQLGQPIRLSRPAA